MRAITLNFVLLAFLYGPIFAKGDISTGHPPTQSPGSDKSSGVRSEEPSSDDSQSKDDKGKRPKVKQPDTNERLYKEEASILERHYPFYFAYGRPLSKLQVSFKAPIVRGVPLYFGYTQFMFWALEEESKPFKDFTYNPELFYRLGVENFGGLSSIDFGIWGHNSNGRSAKDSRSLDRHYVRFNFDRQGPRWVTRYGAQFSYLYNFDETNKNIQTYIGPLSLNLTFIQLFDSWVDKSEVTLLVSPGGKFADRWDRGGYQLSWSFRFGGLDLVPAFYLQYYYGYAETLLNYDKQVSEFRGGVIF